MNTRLAPGVYLGVVPISVDPSGRHRVGRADRIVDWAVHMTRLPDERRADHLLARGELNHDVVDSLAARIAAFHGVCAIETKRGRFGCHAAISSAVEENFAETASTIGRYIDRAEADGIRCWQRSFLQEHVELFDRRVEAGRVREGHGDLRLEHAYLIHEAMPTIIDCIEFCDRFRWGDVCADVAFLSMDLAAHARVDLAERLLARYARETGDFDLYELVDFYESYRAYVRAKVAGLVAQDESIEPAARKRAHEQARRHFLLALSGPRPALVRPSLVAIGGIIASGKSTLAEAVGSQMSAPLIDADRTRKETLGVPHDHPLHDSSWQGAYDPAVTDKVYAEVFRRAGVVLASGRPVVIDASFRLAHHRRAARDLAADLGVPFLFVECCVDTPTARRRLERRAVGPSVSDGRLAIFDDFSAGFEPVNELSAQEHLVLDTSREPEESLVTLRGRLNAWPKGFTA